MGLDGLATLDRRSRGPIPIAIGALSPAWKGRAPGRAKGNGPLSRTFPETSVTMRPGPTSSAPRFPFLERPEFAAVRHQHDTTYDIHGRPRPVTVREPLEWQRHSATQPNNQLTATSQP